jgi:thiol-disulfide isomerase/thioredoxin
MKRPLLTTKQKLFFTRVFLVFSILFIVLLFLFKNRLNDYASRLIQSQADSGINKTESAIVDSTYNYLKNRLSYQVTFLEFGAKGCSACKRMERVMDEIRSKYPNQVNVVFKNIMLPENQGLMKYYGIAAIPAQVLLSKDATEFHRHTGYIETSDLVDIIQVKLP